jgi:adenylosuccinate lyase
MVHEEIELNYFTIKQQFQSYLDVEAALARAQAQQGIIPKWAANIITKEAKIENLNFENIEKGLLKTKHPLVPLIWELDRVCGPKAGGFIHWGATTQNITQTGKLLLTKKAHKIFLDNLLNLLSILANTAIETKNYAMAGRTHGQHAVPATFGYKVAVWIDELMRHYERMKNCENRVFVTMLGGGAGTMASFGMEGLETQKLMAKDLQMASMTMPARTIGDHLTEYVLLLAMFAATASKMGREIYTLMKQEFGEVEEPVPSGTVGSSTMPQKRNPKSCQDIVAWAAELRSLVPLSLESMQTEHEADKTTSMMINVAIDRSCNLSDKIIKSLIYIFSDLKIFPEKMKSNLNLTGGLIMSEQVMLHLGKILGRQRAHDVVYDAAQKSVNESRPFRETLLDEKEIIDNLSKEKINQLLNPEEYLGLCEYFSVHFANKANELIKAETN